MTPGLLLTLALLTTPADEPVSTAPPPPTAEQVARATPGEPLPPGAPTDPYELTSWCYGALGEYLAVYDRVIPDLRDIDRAYGSSVHNEAQPYAADIAAARLALRRFATAMRTAERASAQPIATRGAAAVQQGRAIWTIAERGSRRALARAWLYWGVPDQCEITALSLQERSSVLAANLAVNDPAAAAAARAEPGAVTLAPLTAPPPGSGPPPGSIAPATFAPPAQTPEVADPTPVPGAALAAPPVAAPQVGTTRVIEDNGPAPSPQPRAAAVMPPPVAHPAPAIAQVSAPPAATALAEPAPTPPAPVAPPVTALVQRTASPQSDEPQEPML